MKFNSEIKPGFNTTNKKEVAKAELETKTHYSAVVRHADYIEQQKNTEAPFGKTFKTGVHKNKKDYKREKPEKGKDW